MKISRPGVQSAMTLTELLVVIATIGILAALLLTAIFQAKAKALRIQCVNNVRQIGMALHAFAAENSTYPLYVNAKADRSLYPADFSDWMSTLQHTELSVPGSTNRVIFPNGLANAYGNVLRLIRHLNYQLLGK